MDEVVYRCEDLTEEDIAFLRKIEAGMALVADLSRADALMFCRLEAEEAVVVAQTWPHSMRPIHPKPILGRKVTAAQEPSIFRALNRNRFSRGNLDYIADGAPIVQEVHPIRDDQGRVVGALSIETNLIEHERLRHRSKVFQKALRQLQEMLLRGELEGAQALSSFGEHDGIVVVDLQKRIRYMSGIATNLYRKLGHLENPLGRRLASLDTQDDALVTVVLDTRRCIEEEVEEGERVWIKKGIPLLYAPHRRGLLQRLWPNLPESRLVGVMLTIHDETEARRKEQELKVKSAMIQEIHHRVKNNLQTIASLLRMQARRTALEEVQQALQASINRILSVAVVHEFLSSQEARVINIREVSQRIINQMSQGVLDPDKPIRFDLRGPNLYLPAQQATACALVVSELLQNAVEHGYQRGEGGGTITVHLQDEGDSLAIEVIDDGGGLPLDFDLSQDGSLGLRIVRTLVQDDLKGKFDLKDVNGGTAAIVAFPKLPLGGEELWTEYA